MTPDVERARAFYAKLFDWTYGEMPGVAGGALIRMGERTGGALMDLAACQMPPGTPPAIGVLVKVESADATVTKIALLGGRADAAFDVMENGRMAMCTDPNGALFGIWQPKKQPGMDVDARTHGAPTWFETLSKDAPRAVAFYTALFGWRPVEQSAMPGVKYTLFHLGEQPVGGAMQITPQMKMDAVPAHWGVSFAVKSADETARLARELGATVCHGPADIPGVGRFASVISPQGVAFSVMQWAS